MNRRAPQAFLFCMVCGSIAFFTTGGIFAILERLLNYPLFRNNGTTLFYFCSMAAALIGGMALAARSHARWRSDLPTINLAGYIAIVLYGPMVAIAVRLFSPLLPGPVFRIGAITAPPPPQTLLQHLEWITQQASLHPAPEGRAWWLASALSLGLLLLAIAQPYLIKRLGLKK
jgi:hypothetical protein